MSKIQKALGNIQAEKQKIAAQTTPRVGSSSVADNTIVVPVADRKTVEIDWDVLRGGGLAVEGDEADVLARQLRDIKRPIISNAFGKRATKVEDGNLVMISSALSGEGKTFVSFNLARSMANERDHTVLLVDADVAKPHTSHLFGLENEYGLLDLLEHPEVSVESCIFDTDLPGLSFLPAGRPRPHANELLASSQMERLVHQLAQADDDRIVIFDTPPLLQTSEPKILASFVGQLVLVVGADVTPKEAVGEAISLLDPNKAVNLLLNKAKTDSFGIQVGYGGRTYPQYSTQMDHAQREATVEAGRNET